MRGYIKQFTGRSGGKGVTHNLSRHKLYKPWSGMMVRCYNQDSKDYLNYGGRGITVCELWRNDPSKFIEWSLSNGWKEDLELDRINNDEGYNPMNCKWSTELDQARNRRYCVINPDSAAQIKKLLKAGVYQRVIAKQFGCSRSNIREIKLGHSWVDIIPAS